MEKNRSRTVFCVVYAAYLLIYVSRINLSMAGPELIALDVLDTAQLGFLGSVFSVVYAVGRFVNGAISDRRPPWQMLTTGLAVAGISNLCIGFFPPYLGIFLLWTANAFAQSMLWSSVLCVVSSLYDKKTAKRRTSVMVTSVATGNVVGILLNTFLITRFGVAYAFIIPGVLTALWGIPVLLCTRRIEPPREQSGKHRSVLQLLRDRELRTMCIPAVLHGMMKENISLWMAVYVVDTYLVDLSTSGYYVLLIPVIGLIGRCLYNPVYRLCKERENVVSLIGFVLCLAASLVLCLGRTHIILSVGALSLIYAAVSMINTSILSIFPLRYTKTGNVASVSGITDFATYLGGGISSAIYGSVIAAFGYLPMFLSWVVVSVISMAVFARHEKANQEAQA